MRPLLQLQCHLNQHFRICFAEAIYKNTVYYICKGTFKIMLVKVSKPIIYMKTNYCIYEYNLNDIYLYIYYIIYIKFRTHMTTENNIIIDNVEI
jgi:hypothetical protein